MRGKKEDKVRNEMGNLREEIGFASIGDGTSYGQEEANHNVKGSGHVPREKGAYALGSLIISGLAYHRSGMKRKASV